MKHMDHISFDDVRKLTPEQFDGLLKYFEISGYYTKFEKKDVYELSGFLWAARENIYFTNFSNEYRVLSFNEVVELAMLGLLVS